MSFLTVNLEHLTFPFKLPNDFHFNQRRSLLDEVEAPGGSIRKINNAVMRRITLRQGAAVIDPDANGLPISQISHAHFRAAAKFGVRRGKLR
jgi:hypothetical protein